MDKMSKILLLINLLHHRRVIRPAEIKQICGISTRSLYRYLNTISAGHFPIVFDRTLGGYRLLENTGTSFDRLNVDEAIVVSVALEALIKIVNKSYRDKIEAIIKKLFSSQGMPVEEVWQAFQQKIRSVDNDSDLSNLLTEIIIQTAVMSGRNLGIDLNGENVGADKNTIDSPHLVFDREWGVSARKDEVAEAIPVISIKTAHIKE